MSLPEAASQSLAVLSALAVRIRVPSGLNAALYDATLMVKGGDELARGRIPELGSFVSACRQDPSTVGTKRHTLNQYPDGQRKRWAAAAPFHDGRLVLGRIVLKQLDFPGRT